MTTLHVVLFWLGVSVGILAILGVAITLYVKLTRKVEREAPKRSRSINREMSRSRQRAQQS